MCFGGTQVIGITGELSSYIQEVRVDSLMRLNQEDL